MEFPELSKHLRRSFIELNGIYQYPTKISDVLNLTLSQTTSWKNWKSDLKSDALPPTRNFPPLEGLPIGVCQGEQIRS